QTVGLFAGLPFLLTRSDFAASLENFSWRFGPTPNSVAADSAYASTVSPAISNGCRAPLRRTSVQLAGVPGSRVRRHPCLKKPVCRISGTDQRQAKEITTKRYSVRLTIQLPQSHKIDRHIAEYPTTNHHAAMSIHGWHMDEAPLREKAPRVSLRFLLLVLG